MKYYSKSIILILGIALLSLVSDTTAAPALKAKDLTTHSLNKNSFELRATLVNQLLFQSHNSIVKPMSTSLDRPSNSRAIQENEIHITLSWAVILILIPSLLCLLLLYKKIFLKKHTKQLKQQYEKELEEAVIDRTSRLLEDKEKILNLLVAKSKEIENISHELRTPLTIIKGRANLHLSKENSDDINSTFEVIDHVSKRLSTVLDDFLEIGRINTAVSENVFNTYSISNLIKDICFELSAYADLKNQSLITKVSDDIFQTCNIKQVEKMLLNLISNAIKYTQQGGQITVNLSCYDDKRYKVTVSDNGPGIAEENIPYIFRRFYRCKNLATHSVSGSGIGLSFVDEVVNFYNGNISVESKLEEGSIFSVIMPRVAGTRQENIEIHDFDAEQLSMMMSDTVPQSNNDKLEKAPSITSDKVVKNSDKPSVLIVEDNKPMRQLLNDQLKDRFNVSSACDGSEALQHTLRELPDIVVSDINMPCMDGYTLLDKIKNNPATSHIPVVLVTAKSSSSARILGFRYKADAYISKPYDQDELLEILSTLLFNRQKSQKHALEQLEKNDSVQLTQLDKKSQSAIDRSIECIKSNYHNPDFSIKDLAASIYLSERQLLRKFQDTLGISPRDYINDYRLSIARPMVIQGLKVTEVALKTGFSSAAYFSRQYKKKFGVSPKSDATKTHTLNHN
ncbi:ATP-binding protein [Pleionea sediminis]|uniref:ATP-binding protein n=1 Tax=Pleionea sediminis TaxID=2569479 RepID=UPI00118508BD|nr:ATP-binding protein [Pleionea sediminis]